MCFRPIKDANKNNVPEITDILRYWPMFGGKALEVDYLLTSGSDSTKPAYILQSVFSTNL